MNNDVNTSLAGNLKRLRAKKGYTQDELSDRAGIAYSTVAKLEQGAIKNPSLNTITSLAMALQTEVVELFAITKKPTKISDKGEIKFVYFDVNGVMLRFFQRAFLAISRKGHIPIDKVETLFWHYNEPANRGDITMEEADTYLGEAFGIDNFKWQEFYVAAVETIQDSCDLAKELTKTNVGVGLLTNVMPGALDELIKQGLVPNLKYDSVVDSSVVRAIKPEPKIYEIAEKQAGFSGGEILFIDDSRTNLMAAERFGWHVMWFDDYRPKESIKRVRQALESASVS